MIIALMLLWKLVALDSVPVQIDAALASAALASSGVSTVPHFLSQVNEPETYTVWVTAYSSSPDETDDTPFITASGSRVRYGIIAANFLPFGTKVLIPEIFGDKVFAVEDRMHRRKTENIDIWMPSKKQALSFGITRAKIVVLERPVEPAVLLAEL